MKEKWNGFGRRHKVLIAIFVLWSDKARLSGLMGRGRWNNQQQTSICKFTGAGLHVTKCDLLQVVTCFAFALQRLQQELPHAILRQVGQCGHIPHVEKPMEAAKHVLDFLGSDRAEKEEHTSPVSSAQPTLRYISLLSLQYQQHLHLQLYILGLTCRHACRQIHCGPLWTENQLV